MIIGITGRKRHGKDTLAQRLIDCHGFRRRGLADPVKRAAMLIYGLTWEQANGLDGFDREAPLPDLGVSVRHILQRIGTDVARNIHNDTWVLHMMREMAETPGGLWVVPDVRFPNEARAIRMMGGHVWKVVRPSLPDAGDSHASETGVDSIQEDLLFVNDGPVEALDALVDQAMRA